METGIASGMVSGIDWAAFAAVAFGLLGFGFGFDALVSKMGNKKFGYTSFLVVLGVAMTLIGALLLMPWVYVLMIFGLFAASGLPMIVGDVMRAVGARTTDARRLQDDAIREVHEVFER